MHKLSYHIADILLLLPLNICMSEHHTPKHKTTYLAGISLSSLSILPESIFPEAHPSTVRVPALIPIEIPARRYRMCYAMFQHLRC
jgi:hypothetical protein